MMMGGGGLIDGFAKMILLICVFVALLAGLVGFAANSGLNDAPMDNAEAEALRAETSWLQQQRQMQTPYIEQELEANSALEISRLEREQQLLDAQTIADVAQIETESAMQQADMFAQQQFAQAEQQQKLVQSDRLNMAVTIVITVLLVITILTLAILAILVVNQKLISQPALTTAGVQTNDIWRDPVERRKRIDTLREIDQRERQRMLWQSSRREYSNGHSRSDSAASSPNLIGRN